MKHCALFILIRPDREEKLQPLILEEEMNIESFRSSINFSTQEAALSHQKPVKHFYGFSSHPSNTSTGLAVAEVIFFASKNPLEKRNNIEDAAKFFLLLPKV